MNAHDCGADDGRFCVLVPRPSAIMSLRPTYPRGRQREVTSSLQALCIRDTP